MNKNKATKVKQPLFLFLNELEIPMVKHCRYLGITISTKISDVDIKRQMRKIKHVSANLLHLWNDYKKSTISKVRIAFNNASRKIFGLPRPSMTMTMTMTMTMK